MLRTLRDRIRSYFQFAGDPRRLSLVMVRALVVAFVPLVALGFIDVVRSGHWDDFAQPLVAAALLGWGVVMLYRDRPRPIPLLIAAALGAVAFVVTGAMLEDDVIALMSGPTMILGVTGLLAIAAAGRRAGWVALLMLTLTAVSLTLIHRDRSVAVIVSQVGSSLIVMSVGMVLVRLTRTALDLGTERFRGIFEASPVAFAEIDFSRWRSDRRSLEVISRLNPEARRMLEDFRRVAADEAIAAKALSVLTTILESGSKHGRVTVDVPTRDGTRVLLTSWNTLDADPDRVVASMVDVTDQRRATEALAEQVHLKDRFIATVSHELRTPLTAVQGVLELLAASGVTDSTEREELMGMALSETRDMAGIIQDLLVLARRDSEGLVINNQPTELELLISTVTDTIDAPIDFHVESRAVADCDAIRVRQILRNLLTNAVRYGGPSVQILARSTGIEVEIEVRDDGPPIPSHLIDRMFEPYETGVTDRPTGSIGLGLNVSRILARLMGGDLEYRHDGTHSIFTLRLAAAELHTPQIQAAGS